MQVRSLIFRKQILQNGQINSSQWITLGHPDELELSDLKPMALEDIKAENDSVYCRDSENQYHHIMYLIDHGNDSESYGETSDATLWSEGLGFLSITRIHFPVTTNWDRQFNDLRDHFKNLSRTDVFWRVYGTTELSDLALICRCHSFGLLSRWSLYATNCAKVGKAYTYFCIPNTIIKSETDAWKIEDDNIEYLSMRFAIKDYLRAPSELEKISRILFPSGLTPSYRIAGNEDAIICGENVPIEHIVKLYWTWYQENLGILDIFSNIISRIGADVIAPDCNTVASDPLIDLCVDLLNKIAHCKNIPQDSSWRRPLLELGNTLVHMSRSAILDELVYLILPGLYAFWENIESGNLIGKDEILYQQFVELCVHTIEHLMRAEGQLSQYPEVRPITYDIPVFALEVAIAFLQRLSYELTKPDSGAKKKTNTLLVPSAEVDVSTVELFPANKTTCGLLQITVPFSMLYEPKRLFPALCHELAHYVGEECRMRGLRFELYCKCLASILMQYFFSDCTGNRSQFHKYLVSFICNVLRSEAAVNGNGVSVQEEPLQQIAATANRIAEELGRAEGFANFVKLYLQRLGQTIQPVRFIFPTAGTLSIGLASFKKRNQDLRIVFRETFADICMLYFLKPKPEEYLATVFPKGGQMNENMCLRLLLSLNAAGYTSYDLIDEVRKTHRLGRQEECLVQQRIEKLNTFIQKETFCPEYFLKEYISMCWDKLSRCCPQPQPETTEYERSPIAIYSRITEECGAFNHRMILQDIDQSRREILSDLH